MLLSSLPDSQQWCQQILKGLAAYCIITSSTEASLSSIITSGFWNFAVSCWQIIRDPSCSWSITSLFNLVSFQEQLQKIQKGRVGLFSMITNQYGVTSSPRKAIMHLYSIQQLSPSSRREAVCVCFYGKTLHNRWNETRYPQYTTRREVWESFLGSSIRNHKIISVTTERVILIHPHL